MSNSKLPSAFKALTYTQPSTQPHLTYSPLKPPGPNQLLIQVHAAAINPVDIQLWGSSFFGWMAGKKERGIGWDYSGTIAAVGKELQGTWDVGIEVFGLYSRPTGDGTFSQFVTIDPTDPICKKPKTWSYEEAAAVPLTALTALTMLDWLPAEKSGEQRRVVVLGASGGVGIWVVQLAKKLYNAHVTGICSGKNAAFVRDMGANEIIDYTSQDVPKTLLDSRPGGKKYDLFADCVGGTDMFEHWTSLLHSHAAYITIVGDKTSRTTMGGPLTYLTHPAQILRFFRGYIFGPRYANIMLYQQSELLEKVARLAEAGECKVVVQEVVKGVLEEGKEKEAWERIVGFMEGGRVRGKIVVDIERLGSISVAHGAER